MVKQKEFSYYTGSHRPAAPVMTKEIRSIVDKTANFGVETLISRVGLSMPPDSSQFVEDDFDKYEAKHAYSADLSVLGDQITAAHDKKPGYPRGGSAYKRGDTSPRGAAGEPPSPRVDNPGSSGAASDGVSSGTPPATGGASQSA